MTTKATIQERIKSAGKAGVTSRELRKQLGLASGTATGRVSELLKQGLVKREGRRDGAFVLVWNEGVSLKIHYEILVDSSGSMDEILNGRRKCESARDLVAAQARAIEGEPSIYNFHGRVSLNDRHFGASGMTPLFARTAEAIERARSHKGPKVVLVFTDGDATDSYNAPLFHAAMEAANRDGDVTVAFMVPKGHRENVLLNAGVSPGNIKFWGTVEEASRAAVEGHRELEREVKTSGGAVRSTKTYFKADLSRVTSKDLEQLVDISNESAIYTVQKEEGIDDFFASKKKATGGIYVPGTGFYEVMKKEKAIPRDRKLLLFSPQTGRIYSDGLKTVRGLCGYPEHGDIAVQPGNHAGFVLLAQSKSSAATTFRARILPRGTRAVLWSGAVT